MEDWTSVLESVHQVDVVYLDLPKTLDRVPHARLISKVRSYGVNGKLLQWLEDFLFNRKRQVCLRSYFSDWADIFSGILLESVLGPNLFLVYINDLPNSV